MEYGAGELIIVTNIIDSLSNYCYNISWMDEPMNIDKFKSDFDWNMRAFVKYGDRMDFGRMEGMKDAAIALGLTDAVDYIESQADKYREECSAQCEP